MTKGNDHLAALRRIGLNLRNCPGDGDVNALAKVARELVDEIAKIQAEKRQERTFQAQIDRRIANSRRGNRSLPHAPIPNPS